MPSIRTYVGVLALLAVPAAGAGAREVWTPETGEVSIEEMPRETPEERREYAYALLGLGQWEEGARLLRQEIRQNPDAEWVPQARLSLGRSLLDADRPRRAFEVLEDIDSKRVDEVFVERVRDLQFQAARVRARRSLAGSLDMLDSMMKHMETDEERAFVMKEKADVTRLAGRYLMAMGRYMEAIDAYPRSTWVPYCEYGLALSQWRFAQWLSLGLEDVAAAQRSFADFIEVYPSHPLTPDARKMLAQAQRMRWEMYQDVVEFYAEKEDRPSAALRYAEFMIEEFSEMPDAELQAARLRAQELRAGLSRPMPGDTWKLSAPGLVTSDTQQ